MEKINLGENDTKFFVYGSCYDYCDYMVGDALHFSNVYYLNKKIRTSSRLIQFLFRASFSPKLNKNPVTKHKHFWNRYLLRLKECSSTGKNIFIFFDSNIHCRNISFLKYIKKKVPNSYLVLFFYNYSSMNDFYNISFYKTYFDKIFSYSQYDCEKYGLNYYPGFYSSFPNESFDGPYDSDIFFVGQAKNREKSIVDLYNYFITLGFKVDFNIINASSNIPAGIKTNKLSYQEVIYKTIHSKCILDVSNNNTKGYSLRFLEAICYKKHFISNDQFLKSSKYYKTGFIDVIDLSNKSNDCFDLDARPIAELSKDFSFKNFLLNIEKAVTN